LFLSVIAWFVYNTRRKIQAVDVNPRLEHGRALTLLLIAIRVIVFIATPQMLTNFFGLVCISLFGAADGKSVAGAVRLHLCCDKW
jgi:hypothetical protein